MGLRQPTRIGTFFAQARAGAEQQKEAREKLKKPQALGGAAAAGTQMVAAQTGAQQAATQQVKDTTTKATADLVAGNVGGQTATAITGGSTTPAPAVVKVASGEGGDVAAVDASSTAINNNITTINNQISALDERLRTANAEEAKAINDEKTRLNNLLKGFQEQLTKGNLGQVAGPSTFEQQLTEREALLASEGQNIAKLASIFGPRWVAGRYGGLASQIYGKDLEAIREAAAAGLTESEQAKRLREASLTQYGETLGASKKAFEEKLDTASNKLAILNKSPEELTGYTKDELVKLFGDDANKLFTFDANGKVTGTLRSSTKAALEKTLKDQEAEKLKVGDERTTALNKADELFKTAESKIFGDPQNPAIKGSFTLFSNTLNDRIEESKRRLKDLDRRYYSWNRPSGYSAVTSAHDTLIRASERIQREMKKVEAAANKARTEKNRVELEKLEGRIQDLRKEYGNELRAFERVISEKGFQ
jgi:hypothetical protein